MSNPSPQIYDETGTTAEVRVVFDPVSGGVPTAWQVFRLYNGKGDPFAGVLRGISLYQLARTFGDTASGFRADHAASWQSWVEVEFTGNVGGDAVAQET